MELDKKEDIMQHLKMTRPLKNIIIIIIYNNCRVNSNFSVWMEQKREVATFVNVNSNNYFGRLVRESDGTICPILSNNIVGVAITFLFKTRFLGMGKQVGK